MSENEPGTKQLHMRLPQETFRRMDRRSMGGCIPPSQIVSEAMEFFDRLERFADDYLLVMHADGTPGVVAVDAAGEVVDEVEGDTAEALLLIFLSESKKHFIEAFREPVPFASLDLEWERHCRQKRRHDLEQVSTESRPESELEE